MSSKTKKRFWRALVALLALLLLSFIAPRHWHQHFSALWQTDTERAEFALRMFGSGRPLVETEALHDPHPIGANRTTLTPKSQAELTAPTQTTDVAPPDQTVEEHLVAWEELAQAGIEAHGPNDKIASDGSVDYGPLVASRFTNDEAAKEVFPPAILQLERSLDDLRLARRPLRLAQLQPLTAGGEHSTAVTVWPRATALIEQLERIEGHQLSQKWAQSGLDALDELATVEAIDAARSQEILTRLTALAREPAVFVLEIRDVDLLTDVRAAADALERRVEVWQQVQTLLARGEREQFVAAPAMEEIDRQITVAIASIPGEKAPPVWRKYLALDELRTALRDAAAPADLRAARARMTLERLHAQTLSSRQRMLLSTPEFIALDASLRELATEPIAALEMLYVVEQFEATSAMPDARQLAVVAARHRFSTDEAAAELVRRIDENYRSANVRTAITGELFNRLLPQPEIETDDVGEQILSAWVAGERTTKTELSLKLIPDDDQWRMGMEAHGTTTSDTASYAGSAVLYTQGEGKFDARKLIVVDHHTIHVWPAEAEATFDNWLYGAGTNYDNVPIVGRIARDRAIEQFSQNQWAAQQEVAARMKRRAAKLLDREAHKPLVAVEGQFQKRLLVPLNGAAVEPAALRMYTTEERVVGDYRLAGVSQLGGHTPRPWAPTGSLMSMQIHESALNNVIAGLRLEGREDDLANVYRDIWKVFGVADGEPQSAMGDAVRVHFAEEEAVRIRLEDGRMEVIIKLRRLETERRTWRDLVVRNFYVPDPSTRRAVLVRDESVRLVGERLGVRDQIALRAIFSKIFASNSEFPLLGEQLADNPGVADLEVTQYVIHDGWIGLALGLPPRTSGDLPVDREARRPLRSGGF